MSGTHPSRNQLERFLHGDEMSEGLQAAIVRHLLARCPQCLEVTGRISAGASGKVPKPKRAPGDAPKRRRAPLSAAARAALESAAQERLLELAGVLQKVSRELKSIAEALPPPSSGEGSLTVELRAVIDCVLMDSIKPAIENLRAAAAPYV